MAEGGGCDFIFVPSSLNRRSRSCVAFADFAASSGRGTARSCPASLHRRRHRTQLQHCTQACLQGSVTVVQQRKYVKCQESQINVAAAALHQQMSSRHLLDGTNGASIDGEDAWGSPSSCLGRRATPSSSVPLAGCRRCHSGHSASTPSPSRNTLSSCTGHEIMSLRAISIQEANHWTTAAKRTSTAGVSVLRDELT